MYDIASEISIDIFEGSLEAKLPTVWTDGKAQPELGRGESQRWRKSEERRCRFAKR